jgi:ABC-type Fe3+-hydroxamate transport system substrate-binding protein
VNAKNVRVVSLVPSVTETLVALGVVPVGCTRFCDLEGVQQVGGTKRVDVDAVVALAPDLVVVNDEENRIEDANALRSRSLVLHEMSPHVLADVGPCVAALATRVGVTTPPPFDAWDAWMAHTRRPAFATAFVPIWRRPYMSMAADTYGSSLLEHLGIENVYADAGTRYPQVELDAVAARAPALALLPSEPYEFTRDHVREVRSALPGARVELVDGRDLFWWGIRTPDAAARLAAQLA